MKYILPFICYTVVAQAMAQTVKPEQLTDLQVVGLTILMEARSEGRQGMEVVGQVILNRMLVKNKSAREICLQKYQFEVWGKPHTAQYLNSVLNERINNNKIAAKIAINILNKQNITNTTATHYHDKSIKPSWADKLVYLGRVGDFFLYREDKRS